MYSHRNPAQAGLQIQAFKKKYPLFKTFETDDKFKFLDWALTQALNLRSEIGKQSQTEPTSQQEYFSQIKQVSYVLLPAVLNQQIAAILWEQKRARAQIDPGVEGYQDYLELLDQLLKDWLGLLHHMCLLEKETAESSIGKRTLLLAMAPFLGAVRVNAYSQSEDILKGLQSPQNLNELGWQTKGVCMGLVASNALSRSTDRAISQITPSVLEKQENQKQRKQTSFYKKMVVIDGAERFKAYFRQMPADMNYVVGLHQYTADNGHALRITKRTVGHQAYEYDFMEPNLGEVTFKNSGALADFLCLVIYVLYRRKGFWSNIISFDQLVDLEVKHTSEASTQERICQEETFRHLINRLQVNNEKTKNNAVLITQILLKYKPSPEYEEKIKKYFSLSNKIHVYDEAKKRNNARVSSRLQKITSLPEAVRNGHFVLIEQSLRSDPDLKAVSENKSPALHIAARKGAVEIVDYLLNAVSDDKKKIVLNSVDKKNNTALHVAVMEGQLEAAVYLLRQKLLIDTSLKNNDKKTVFEVVNKEGKNLFQQAIEESEFELAARCWRSMPEVCVLKEQDPHGNTVIHACIKKKLLRESKWFLDAQALIPWKLRNHRGKTILTITDKDKNTWLHQATQDNSQRLILFLAKQGADFTQLNAAYHSPYHIWLSHYAEKHVIDMEMLIQSLDKDATWIMRYVWQSYYNELNNEPKYYSKFKALNDSMTLVWKGLSMNQMAPVNIFAGFMCCLLDHLLSPQSTRIDIEYAWGMCKSKYEQLPVLLKDCLTTAFESFINLVKLNTKNKEGYTPLHLAAKNNDVDNLIAGIREGAVLTIRSDQDETMLGLLMAANRNDVTLAGRILSEKAPDFWHLLYNKYGQLFAKDAAIQEQLTEFLQVLKVLTIETRMALVLNVCEQLEHLQSKNVSAEERVNILQVFLASQKAACWRQSQGEALPKPFVPTYKEQKSPLVLSHHRQLKPDNLAGAKRGAHPS